VQVTSMVVLVLLVGGVHAKKREAPPPSHPVAGVVGARFGDYTRLPPHGRRVEPPLEFQPSEPGAAPERRGAP
jgi:hypothetical protein